MSRLALSPADGEVRNWFVETTKALGCEVTVDEMGNIFAVRPGRRGKDVPATFVGSHLDTQPTGGRYDGILGVCAGVEMLRVLNDKWIETEGGVGVVNWTKYAFLFVLYLENMLNICSEEGARFPMSMMASGVWAGKIPLEKAHANASVIPANDTHTVKYALEAIGYLGSTPASHIATPMAAHFELHIEQGPHLIEAGQKIGIVEGVQAYRWHTLTVQGRDAHTGTTSFEHRADALQVAAKIIIKTKKVARELDSLASTGILTLKPGSINTIPGWVQFTLDLRSPSDDTLMHLEQTLKTKADKEALKSPKPVTLDWQLDFSSPATNFHPKCITCVEESATSILTPEKAPSLMRKMISGAGHDSVFTNKRCPTSMIFVPCRDGVSHHPEEYSTPEDCALGASVLTGAVVRFDRRRFQGDSGI
jgi:hydantoinase/carbamoylase family amidase